MEKRKQPPTITKPQLSQKSSAFYQAPIALPPNNAPRPLSDIRELSEPSIIDTVFNRNGQANERDFGVRKAASARPLESSKESGSARSRQRMEEAIHNQPPPNGETSSTYSSTPEQSSFYTIPYSSVPRRSSSQTHAQRPTQSHGRKPSIRAAPPPLPKFESFTVPNHGQSHSPVKQAAARSDPVKSDEGRRIPSRTYIRTPQPADILEFPSYRHPRVKLELRVSAPLFVGGGSIEGVVHVTVDDNERARARRSLAMGGLAVDLLGFEDMPNGRKAAFLAVVTELIDTSHPPPTNMVEPPNPLAPDEKFWTLTPSTSALPFMISLPLDTGPPPFRSKIANIRFLLCATALISDAGKHYRVRISQDVSVIATYDPEKALTSLTSPLTTTDQLLIPRFGRCDSLKVTAGLHRQVWVSGSSIFVDLHIVNRTHKPVKRLDLNLERDILCYKHPPAGTSEKSASHARIFESNEQTMIIRSEVKPGQQGWNGVSPHSSETRTCELQIPRGHATVRCGKYFEVRFFLNITASLTNTKLVTVQLPIILIHMNSLDVLPNSVAQVAAAIEEKRMEAKRHERRHSRQRSSSSPSTAMAEIQRRPSYSQGRAFAAPRQQSIRRQRALKSDLEDLGHALDSSPRRFAPKPHRQRALKPDLEDLNSALDSSPRRFAPKTGRQRGVMSNLINNADQQGCESFGPEFRGPEFRGTLIKKVGSNFTIGAFSLGKNSGPTSESTEKQYKTPPGSTHSGRTSRRGGVRQVGSLNPLPRMQSFDTIWTKKTDNPTCDRHGRKADIKPQFHFSVPRKGKENQTVRMMPSNTQHCGDCNTAAGSISRPSTGLSFREKMDRRRFEVRGVKQKSSGTLRERGMHWIEQLTTRDRDGGREGWI